jgi:hypothetical protein
MVEAGADELALYYGEPGEPKSNLRRATEAVFDKMISLVPANPAVLAHTAGHADR